MLCLLILVIAGLAGGLVVAFMKNDSSSNKTLAAAQGTGDSKGDIGGSILPTAPPGSVAPLSSPFHVSPPSSTSLPTMQPTFNIEALLAAATPNGKFSFQNAMSPQSMALQWLLGDPKIKEYRPVLLKERYAVSTKSLRLHRISWAVIGG
jgi:hypothetical protein